MLVDTVTIIYRRLRSIDALSLAINWSVTVSYNYANFKPEHMSCKNGYFRLSIASGVSYLDESSDQREKTH